MAHRLLLGLALRAEILPPPPPSQSEQRQGCYGKWYCIAGSVPSASHSPEQAGLPPRTQGPQREGLLVGWPRVQIQQLPPPPSSEPESQPRGGGASMSTPHVSFCK